MDRWRTWNAQKLPGRAVNRYVRGWIGRGGNALAAIEVHRTACIVTHPPGGEHANHALVNPANEGLVGTRFTPEECWRNLHGDPTTGRWSEDYVVYPTQAIDGLVTEFGGEALKLALESLPADQQGHRCSVGRAVATPALGELHELYSSLIHTVPPLYRTLAPDVWEAQLRSTYQAVYDTAHRLGLLAIAVPLIGAGARGAPKVDAIRVAAEAAVTWSVDGATDGAVPTARFGVQDSSTAHALVAALEDVMAEHGLGRFDAKPPPQKERWALSKN